MYTEYTNIIQIYDIQDDISCKFLNDGMASVCLNCIYLIKIPPVLDAAFTPKSPVLFVY